ncbi:helix-turn-helix domain-containing protein [Bacillus sp. HNG]|uniref:helix-turn-helix domain-containing protein n=1 Tax=Bacillus sp. HNG TaxID=2293325 RepID=UPI0026C85EF7|nr:helix-turn-helix domain-containing protein [Bacillus sp. HNG]
MMFYSVQVAVPNEESMNRMNSNLDNEKYPFVLTADHVAEIVGVSTRVAYELMERKDFPLIRIGRLKRVNRDEFFKWLNQPKSY